MRGAAQSLTNRDTNFMPLGLHTCEKNMYSALPPACYDVTTTQWQNSFGFQLLATPHRINSHTAKQK